MGGGNAAGYAARTFVEHGMAGGKLCIVSKEVIFLVLISFLLLFLNSFYKIGAILMSELNGKI